MTILFLHYFSNKTLEFNLLGLLLRANNLEREKHNFISRIKKYTESLIRAFLHAHLSDNTVS
jgi:hypothetical protein